MSLSVYSINLYFNMTAFKKKKKKPSNWDSSQRDGFCLQLKARCESTRAQQLNVWQVRAAGLVQQKGVDLGSPEGRGDAGRDQVLSGDPPGVSPPARKNGREGKKGRM